MLFCKNNRKEGLPYRILFLWLWKVFIANKTQAITNTVFGVFIVLLELAFVWVTKFTIDIATLGSTRFTITDGAILLILIIVVQTSISFLSKWVRAILGIKAQNELQQSLFDELLKSNWIELEQYHSGDIINRIERDVRDTIEFLTESIPSLFTVFVQLIGGFLFLFLMDEKLACLILIVMPVFIILSKLYFRKMRLLTNETRKSDSNIQALLQESMQHRMVIKTLEQNQTIADRLISLQLKLRSQIRSKTKYSSISSSLMSLGFSAGYLITFIWGVTELERGAITYGSMIAFIQLVGQIQRPIGSMTRFIPVFISAFTAAERLIELESIKKENKDSMPTLSGSIGIRFKNVDFAYTDKGKKILQNFSFDFHRGECIAILGETGTGKTTLIRLILSLIHPSKGTVTIYNEKEEQSCSVSSRSNFSYVPQGNTLFSGTIADNLRLGKPSATKEEMENALRLSCADFVTDRLPLGLETKCGEGGHGLSEGQAQRICIARALLRNRSVLLFDEATSALDEATEERLLKNIVDNYRNSTLIFITHKQNILKHASTVLTL